MPSLPVSLARLGDDFAGRIILPDDPDYDPARTLFYAGLDNRPAVVLRPCDAAGVARAVGLARETGVPLAVRSGGHGFLGHGGLDDGIVLDLSAIRGLEIDVAGRTAWAGAGLTTGEYTAAAATHGLATGFGDTGSVGIGGLTVGGGVGLLVRKHGLTIDQLLAAELVTADGEVRRVDARTHPDLFWAIRGGSGNVGVVTRFQFRLHELPSIVGGFLFLPLSAAVVAGFVAAARSAPDELSTIANIMAQAPPLPMIPPEAHGRPIVFAMIVYAGDGEDGERAMEPFRALAPPIADMLGPRPYADMFPPEEQDGFHPAAVAETFFRDDVDLSAARTILTHLEMASTPMAVAQLRVLGGAAGRVPVDATAYAHRKRQIMVNIAALFPDPADAPRHRPWVERFAGALADGEPGGYVNFLGRDGADGARAAFPGATWDRLGAVKRAWDPDNLFRRNVNVPPAAG